MSRSREVDGQRGSPASGSEHGGGLQARAPIRRSVPDRSRCQLARCLKRIKTAVPIAASTTAIGSPVSHAAGGSAIDAAIEQSDTYRVSQTVTRNNPAATPVAAGESIENTP